MLPRISLIIISVLLIFTSCVKRESIDEYQYEIGEVPVNLGKFNSPFDDFGVKMSSNHNNKGMYFSSNRASIGGSFDVVFENFDMINDNGVYKLVFTDEEAGAYQSKLINNINTNPSCEVGPFLFMENNTEYFFFASNADGPFRMKYFYAESPGGEFNGDELISDPVFLEAVNTGGSNYFPTLDHNTNQLLFCSSREGKFDIFSLNISTTENLKDYLAGISAVNVSKNTVFSSEFNDRTPSVKDDLMVFSSDREGGYGGYDLYYSKYVNGNWTEPVNFGSEINSEYDDYAPYLFDYSSLENILIFSSKRPEGQGRYDLYIVDSNLYLQN